MAPRKRKPFSQISVDEEEANVSRKRSKGDTAGNDDCTKRAGTINYMILKNFMCHSLLEVVFTNNINIIIGKNGSGKSAILTALVVGLGGKASLTNRGNSVKGFVKASKPSGSIEIQLSNEGPMAYRPSVYGKHITVVRNLSANGGGSYRLRSESGEIISTQAKELHNITSALNIQIDNPVCLLNQDTSRNFLGSNNPKNKFALFMKATKLDVLETEYRNIQLNKRESVRIMEEKAENFRKLQDEIKRLKKKIDSHQSIVNLKDRQGSLQSELVWAKVRDVENELENEKSNVAAVEKKLGTCKKNSLERVEMANSLKETIRTLEMEIQELKSRIEVEKRPQLDIRNQIDELSGQYSTKRREIQQVKTAIEAKNKDVASLKQDIVASEENMSKVEQQKMQRIKKLEALQNKLKGMDDHLETVKNDLFQTKSDLNRREEEEHDLHTELREVDQKIAYEKKNLNALREQSGDDLILYGRDMPKVKQMIQQYKDKFTHVPKGPLGAHIKLKDKKWAVAVEGHLGPGTLGAFVVDNNKDNKLLRDIFNRVWTGGRQPQIITTKFVHQRHNVSRNLVQAPPDCVALYDAIEIDDPIVSNCIVDSTSPENILLIPTDQRAMELLSNKNHVPRNCHQAVTMKGDRYYPDPNYRTYASNYHRAQYLQVDSKEYMRQLQVKIEDLIKKKQAVSKQLEAFIADMREKGKKRDQLEEKVRKVNMARSQIRRQLEELNSSAEPEVQNIQYLQQELEEVRKSVNEKTAELGKLTEEMKEIKTRISANEIRLSQMKDSTKELESRIQNLKDEAKENQTKQRELSTSDEFDKRQVQQCEAKLIDARAQMVQRQNELKNCTEQAVLIGPRLTELRQVPEISSEINDVKHRIARIETDSENLTDLTDRYKELREKYMNSAEIMESLQSDITEMTLAVDRRNKHYKLTESYFVMFMKYSFKKVLEFRQFEGTININMADKKLDLVVIPQHGSQGLTTTSNLSGGEKSFSTVAFLYSLWQCMEFPFYFLDEFDVYMDKLNRTKVIDILVHHAKSKPQLQFVFLTPQDVSFIHQDISILRLEDPERFNL